MSRPRRSLFTAIVTSDAAVRNAGAAVYHCALSLALRTVLDLIGLPGLPTQELRTVFVSVCQGIRSPV